MKNKSFAFIDYEKIDFPLILRKWHKGDYFQPFGMQDFKKLSDYFIDNKISIYDKENTWILTSGEKIIWIVGQRLDERFKVESHTSKIIKIELSTNS